MPKKAAVSRSNRDISLFFLGNLYWQETLGFRGSETTPGWLVAFFLLLGKFQFQPKGQQFKSKPMSLFHLVNQVNQEIC
jgi:hypothetical protein